jgi:hypothetical protein
MKKFKKYIKHLNWAAFALLVVLTLLGITPVVGMGMLITGIVGRAAGYPDYTADGLNKLIPILFSGEARENLYARTCLSDITNTDFTGEIKNLGDRVEIPTDPHVTVSDYVKGKLLDVEYLESPAITYTVDYAKSFNFAVDDIDQKQFKIKDWVSRYGGIAARDVKQAIETHFLSLVYADADTTNSGLTAGADADITLGVTGTPVSLSATNVTDYIADCAQCLSDNNVPEEDRYMVIPQFMKTLLMKSEYKDASGTGMDKSAMLKGRSALLPIHGFTIYDSNLLTKDSGTANYHMIFGQKMATSFVSQFVKVEKYRPERAFSDAMKGLNVYGFKTIQPKALGTGVVKKG